MYNYHKVKLTGELSMKKVIVALILLAIGFSLGVFVPLKQNVVQANNETQADMDKQAYNEWKKADDELNRVYNQVLKKYKNDKVFISKLQKAELAWIKYRDAEIEAIYPEDDKMLNYGTSYPVCVNLALMELTKQRTKELKLWLKGIQEGDVCAGSRGCQ